MSHRSAYLNLTGYKTMTPFVPLKSSSPVVASAKAELFKHHVTMGPLVLQALPAHGSPPVSARQIAGFTRSTIHQSRKALRTAVRLGLAAAEEKAVSPNVTIKLYTRAPSLQPDDFEDARHAYGKA